MISSHVVNARWIFNLLAVLVFCIDVCRINLIKCKASRIKTLKQWNKTVKTTRNYTVNLHVFIQQAGYKISFVSCCFSVKGIGLRSYAFCDIYLWYVSIMRSVHSESEIMNTPRRSVLFIVVANCGSAKLNRFNLPHAWDKYLPAIMLGINLTLCIVF